jgi:hypothetical protein
LLGAGAGGSTGFFLLQHEELPSFEHPLVEVASLGFWQQDFFFFLTTFLESSLLTIEVPLVNFTLEAIASVASIEPITKPNTKTIFFIFTL